MAKTVEVKNGKRVEKRNISPKNKEREAFIKEFSLPKAIDFVTDGYINEVTIKELIRLFLKGYLIFPGYQRGSVWKKSTRVSYVNNGIHGILRSPSLEVAIIIPYGKPYITIKEFLKDCRKKTPIYVAEGYRMELVDGGQRFRSLLGFHCDEKGYETELYGEKLSEDEVITIEYTVQEVKFSELPEEAQIRFEESKLPITGGESRNLNGEINTYFDILNSSRKALSKSDSMHNLFGASLLWEAAYEECANEHTINLLGINQNKSYHHVDTSTFMQDDEDEIIKKTNMLLMQGDNGKAVYAVLKLLKHVDHQWMAEGTNVNSSIIEMSLDNSEEYDTKEKVETLMERYATIVNLCNLFPEALSSGGKKSENRVRSLFAAVSILNHFHEGLIEQNEKEIHDMFIALQTVIPSSQDGSAKASTINNEIAMYVAMIMYVCGIEDKRCLKQNSIKNSLVFNMSSTHKVDMLTPLEDYFAEKNKISA